MRCPLVQRPFLLPFVLLVSVLASHARAAEIFERFTESLSKDWSLDLSTKSTGGTVTPTPTGILMKCEPRMHVLIKRELADPGNDAYPLDVNVLVRSQPGFEGPLLPGMTLLWDNANYLYTRISGDGHFFFGAVIGGVLKEQVLYHSVREIKPFEAKKAREAYVRILLTAHNAAFFNSHDGVNWHRAGESNGRPGPAGKAPKLILGRGWAGEGNAPQPELSNDWYPDKSKVLLGCMFANLRLTDKPLMPEPQPEITKQDTWEQTTAGLDVAGMPRAWSFLGPVQFNAQGKEWTRTPMAPDQSDDWSGPMNDPGGKAIKAGSWVRPEEEQDGHVDLGEHVGRASHSLGWARTEVDWPVAGEGLVWFGSSDLLTIYVNNVPVYEDREDSERRTLKDQCCIPVAFNKGKNVVKIRCRQTRGDLNFYLRMERNDPAYRVAVLEKMLSLFPDKTAGWRAPAARHEIISRLEQMRSYPAAIAACDKAIAAFADDDDNRLRALEAKFRLLEFLRDFEALTKAGEDYIAAYPSGVGADRAIRATLRGDALGGKGEAATARLKRYITQSSGLRPPTSPATKTAVREDCATSVDSIVDLYKHLAAAFQDAGDDERRCRVLEELATVPSVPADERARAALESACVRWDVERHKQAPQQPDESKLALAGKAMSLALAQLPTAKNPAVAALEADAKNDFLAKKPDRALGGYWGAMLLALCASSSEADVAPYLTLTKAFKLPEPKDKDGKPIADGTQYRKALWKALLPACGDVTWSGKWRFVGFRYEANNTIRTAMGPETDSNKADYGNGRRWVDMDLDADPDPDVFRGNHDHGIDLRKWSGNAQLGYVSRDFEVTEAGEKTLFVGASGAWLAWIDGAPVGENANNNAFRIEGDRLKLQLTPGKHRLLLKLEAPGEGAFLLRGRIGTQPELALHLYIQALLARQFPAALIERKKDLQWLTEFTFNGNKTPVGVPYGIAEVAGQLFSENAWQRLEPQCWAIDKMRDSNDNARQMATLRSLVRRIDTGGWYLEKSRQYADLALRYAGTLVCDGRAGAADAVLRDVANRCADLADAYCSAQISRGALRRDYGQSQTAQPFFDGILREKPGCWRAQHGRLAPGGAEWCRGYRPERLMLDTSHEVQAALDAVRRQLSAGGVEDIDRAMRNVADLLSSAPGSLTKVRDSPFYARFVGVREYIRSLLSSLPAETLGMYRKAVAPVSGRRLKTAMDLGEVPSLEVLANEFYYTPAAFTARNHAGNLHLDRGQFAQAASTFHVLLREIPPDDRSAMALALAKLARALASDGQDAAAERALERLRTEFASVEIKCGGQTQTGAALANRLQRMVAGSKPATDRPDDVPGQYATLLGGLCRTGVQKGAVVEPGPVVWAHELIPNAFLERTRNAFELDTRDHLPSYPVIASGIVYVSSFESVRAIELATGKPLWTRTWPPGMPPFKGMFNGYPLSCPTVTGGNVYLRAMESTASSLRCYAADSGKMRWNTGSAPNMRKMCWISDPAIAYGLAIALYLEPGDMNTHGLAAVDADTGRLRWKTALVTGNTGVRTGDQWLLSTLHMGPPAIDGGEVYVTTGLSSVAAVNAFSGEIKWVSTYPRLQFADRRSGQSGAGFDLRQCTLKAFSRGPQPALIADDLIIVAPKDANGVIAFERQSGTVRWRKELFDARFLIGLSGGNVLLADDTLTAVRLSNGTTAWEHPLVGQWLFGQPTLSGGQIYAPTDKELRRIDARSGCFIGSTPWDPRVGPLGNFIVTAERIVGVNDGTIAALGPASAKSVALPLYEARELETSGKLEAANERYGALLGSKDPSQVLQALLARTRILQRLGKRDEALAALQAIEQEPTALLSASNGLWQVKKDVFARALRSRLGEKVPPAPAPAGELNGLLSYAWHLPGENPRILRPQGSSDSFFVHSGSDLYCLRASDKLDLQWHNFIGPNVGQVAFGPSAIAAVSDFRITTLDRSTGESLGLPLSIKMEKPGFEIKPFEDASVGESTITAVSGLAFFTWDLASGAPLWWKRQPDWRPTPAALTNSDGKLIKVYGCRDSAKNDLLVCTFDARTGAEQNAVTLGTRGNQMAAWFTPDSSRAIYRAEHGLFCVDVPQMKPLWRAPGLRLEMRGGPLFYDGNVWRYMGSENGWGKFFAMWLDPNTGKEIPLSWTFADKHTEQRTRIEGTALPVNGEYIVLTGEWGRVISRVKVQPDKGETVWSVEWPVQMVSGCLIQAAFSGGDRFHLLYAQSRNNQDELILRTFTWEHGLFVGEQTLPGTPPRLEDGTIYASTMQMGSLLLYAAREGVFAFSSAAEAVTEVTSKLRAELTSAETPAQRRCDVRRSLAHLEPSSTMAFLAPPDLRVDGDLSEWSSIEPLKLETVDSYVPLNPSAKWNGKDDLSARLYVAWNLEGLALAVDVTDDVCCPPQVGADLNSGDSIRVVVDARPEPGSALDRAESFVASLALVGGRPVLDQEHGQGDDAGAAQGHVTPAPNGKGYRYEMLIPWSILRKDPSQRPGTTRQLQLGVAIFDDDGSGVKGAMELGAGVTVGSYGTLEVAVPNAPNFCVPRWLTGVTLLDVSQEKIQRYRKVIDLVPDSEEAFRFLQLILLSKRGAAADSERAAELESFIKNHTDSRCALRAIAHLRSVYRAMGTANPQERLSKFLSEIKAPASLQQAVASNGFRFWVLPDAKQPPQMIMVQFFPQASWARGHRAYWGSIAGTQAAQWGVREGTVEMMRMGQVPKPGVWTELTISPFDLGLDGEVKEMGFTEQGGVVHFDRAVVVVEGKEKVFIDDQWPEKMQIRQEGMKFVDQPKHDGAKAWTFESMSRAGFHNAHLVMADGSTMFSFAGTTQQTKPAADPAKDQALYRKVAQIISDTPEGMSFLQRALDLHTGDGNAKNAKCIDELRAFLKTNPYTPNAMNILKMLYNFYAAIGEKNPRSKCEDVIIEFRLSRDVKRGFFAEFAPVWSEWQVLGPFGAQGERRGMDQVMGPEKAVDLNFKTVDASGREIGWKKITNLLDEKKKPYHEPIVDLCRHMSITRTVMQRGPYFGYAYSKFTVPTKRRALMLFGANEIVSIWLNGKRVVNELETQVQKDKEAVDVQLRSGENEVLIKIGASRDGRGQFVFRLSDFDGRPFSDVINE
ncbi:MAG TPA: PQQ-binding-like beta-propeller repeat protein [Planctomycetota bacterium]|jgi:outer membrane protein assembly factor BamB